MSVRVRSGRWALLVVVAFLLAALSPRDARADGDAASTAQSQPQNQNARLTVERAKGARNCADGAAIEARINAMTGREAIRDDADLGIVVSIERAKPGFRAIVKVEGTSTGTRELIDNDASCSALGEVIAIAVVFLLDAQVPGPPAPIRVTRKEKPPPPPPSSPIDVNVPPPAASRLPSWTLDILAAQTAGLVTGANFGVLAEVNVVVTEHLTVGAFGMGVLPEDIPLDRGKLRVNLAFGGFPACYTARTEDAALGVAFCGFPAAGAMIAEGQGLDVDATATLPWIALGGAVVADGPIIGPINFSGRFTLLAPLTRPSFQVEDLGDAPQNQVGVVFEPAPVGVAFAYGIRALLP